MLSRACTHNWTTSLFAGQTFEWSDGCQAAVDTQKTKLTGEEVMAYPADDGLFILETDASHTGIDATLSQVQWYEQSQKKRGATNHICQPIHNELQSMVNHRLVILLVQFIMLLTLTFAVVFSTLSRTNEEMRTCCSSHTGQYSQAGRQGSLIAAMAPIICFMENYPGYMEYPKSTRHRVICQQKIEMKVLFQLTMKIIL